MPPHTSYDDKFLVSFSTAEHDDQQACCRHHPDAAAKQQGRASLTRPLPPALTRRRKSISFNERVLAKKTLHLADLTEEETQACWYAEDEFRRIKRDVLFEANLLENEFLLEQEQGGNGKYCPRGLEHLTTLGAEQRSANKRQSLSVVLEEQKLQREEGSYDPAFIAEIYANAVVHCRDAALAYAEQDRLAAIY